jgi:hypothetical protein
MLAVSFPEASASIRQLTGRANAEDPKIVRVLLIKSIRTCELVIFYCYVYVSTLTEVFPCLFLRCKANARAYLAKTGHDPHSS